MGVLDHLIAPKRSKRRTPAVTRRTPLGALLLPQFERLGLPPGELPHDGPTGSAWSRGYVLGAACASLQHQGVAPVSDQDCFATARTAFAMTYGEASARRLLAATVAAAEAHEPEIEDGLMQGAGDLALIATGQADGTTLQFVSRNAEELATTD